jgi:hypothetical protein
MRSKHLLLHLKSATTIHTCGYFQQRRNFLVLFLFLEVFSWLPRYDRLALDWFVSYSIQIYRFFHESAYVAFKLPSTGLPNPESCRLAAYVAFWLPSTGLPNPESCRLAAYVALWLPSIGLPTTYLRYGVRLACTQLLHHKL